MTAAGEESRLDMLMRAYRGIVPGACVAVLNDGVPILRRAYGLADMEGGVAAASCTNYRLASMTKQFTAAAILLLAEDGRVSLADPVRRWLPGLGPAADAINVRHLLTHTSGLIDFEDLIPPETTEQLRDADVLALLETENRVHFAAGTRYRYSNSGYSLLALIVAGASGMRFAAFLRERIFLPLDMQNSVAFEAGISSVPYRAFGYREEGHRWIRADQNLTSATLGDGGIYSSIDDLGKWDAALHGGRLLQAASLRSCFSAATSTDDPAVQYGFGWRISGGSVWHSGETTGFRNAIIRDLERGLTVIVLTNRDDPPPYPAARAIAAMFTSRQKGKPLSR